MKKEVISEYIGEFWLPGNYEQSINCELVLNNGEVKLSTQGEFPSQRNSVNLKGEYDVIFGNIRDKNTSKSSNAILYSVFNTSWSADRLAIKKYHVEFCLINHSKAVPNDLNFYKLLLFSDVLNSILINKNFIIQNSDGKLDVSYKAPEDLILFQSDKFTFKISYKFEYTGSRGTITLTETPFLSVDFSQSYDVYFFLFMRQSLERWVSVILHRSFQFDISLLHNTNSEYYEVFQKRNTSSRAISNYDQQKLVYQLQTTHQNWTKFEMRNKEAINTFFFVYSDFNIDVFNRFINYVFALEKLHRVNFSNKYELKASDRRMLDEFEKLEIRGDLKSWINKQIKKEKSVLLANRLKDLVQSTFNNLGNTNLVITEIEIKRIVDTRHYLAHLSEDQKANAFNVVETVVINEKLEELFMTFVQMKINQ